MDQSADSWIGKRIGQYIIQSLIKKGGMSHVYYAIDQALERPVALKILFSELTEDASFVERFRREARSVAKLRHPNIVQIYTTGITPEGQNYIAMEYISGGSLREQLQHLNNQGHVLQTEDALNIARQVASALSVAHRAGIVHRDIKPSNILLRTDGTAVITDLGIAKIQSEETLTRVDEIVGTPYYMSPEQVSSKPVDARSDLYSLGMILYEMLTGQRVFTGDTPWSILSKHITDTPKPISELRPDISPQIAYIVHTCLQKDPDNRYQSAADLITNLDQVLYDDQPMPMGAPNYAKVAPPTEISATPTPINAIPFDATRIAQPTETASATQKKRPLWLILILVLLCLGGGTAVFFLSPLRGMVLGTATPVVIAAENTPTATSTEEPSPLPTNTTTPEIETAVNTPTPEPPDATETATVTPKPTQTPKPTATERATNTPKPTASPTPKPTNTPGNPTGGSSAGSGLPMGFDQFGTWVRGNEPNGSFTQSTAQAHSGSTSGKISYDFTSDDNDYVVFMQSNPIEGQPTALQIWVYGDGKGHYLNAWIQDREGQTWQVPFGKINHTGWKQMTGYIDTNQDWPWQHISGPKNDEVDYPISFRGFVLDDLNNAFNGSGNIYLDDLTTANIPYTGSSSSGGGTGNGDVADTDNDSDDTPDADDTTTSGDPGNVGRILYTSGSSVLTTDPAWSGPQELGTAASNTCSNPASTVTGESYNLYYGLFCNITGGIDVCPSPNGLYEVVVNGWVEGGTAVSVRPPGTEDYTFVYQGSLDAAEGIRWSPTSDSFLFVTGDTVNRAFPAGNYNQLFSPAYTPIFSQDGSMILYLKPIGPGVKDIFVSNSDGSNARNVTNVSTIDKSCHAWRR